MVTRTVKKNRGGVVTRQIKGEWGRETCKTRAFGPASKGPSKLGG